MEPETRTGNLANLSNNTSDYSIDYSYDFYEVARDMVYPETYEWVILSFFVLLILLALGGNTLVLYAVLRNEHMRSVTNYYIVNLSVADILVSLICFGPTVLVDVTETWWLGDIPCKLIPYFQVSYPIPFSEASQDLQEINPRQF